MRKRAAIILAATAALGCLTTPAAHADGGWGDTTITSATVNGGKDVVIGTTYAKTFKVTVKGYDNSGLSHADTDLEGPGYGYFDASNDCESSTSCSSSFTIDPRVDLYNDNAGTWYVGSWVDANDGDYRWTERIGSFRLKRASTLTTNATPEPVAKGKTITVYGTLKRASWETYKYAGYTNQPVKLQFRKAGSSTYSTIKTVYTGTGGALKTGVTASADGYWRWSFAGTTTTAAKTSTSDYVDVQ